MLQAFFHKKINIYLFVPVGNGLVYDREGHRTFCRDSFYNFNLDQINCKVMTILISSSKSYKSRKWCTAF